MSTVAENDLFHPKKRLVLSKEKRSVRQHLPITDSGQCPHCRKQITSPAYGDGLEGSDKIQSRCVMVDKKSGEMHALCPGCKKIVKV
jgi:hypothetical protein